MFKRVTEISFNQYIVLSFFSCFWKIQAWASFFIDISGMFSPMCLDYWVCPQGKVDKGDDPFSTRWKRLWTPPLNYIPVFFPLLSSPIPHPPHLIFTILPLIFSKTYFSLHSITILASTLLSSSRVQDYKAWGPSWAILQGNGPASLPLQWKHSVSPEPQAEYWVVCFSKMTPSTTPTDNVRHQCMELLHWFFHISSYTIQNVSYPFPLSSSEDFLLGLLIPSILAFGCPLNSESTIQSTTENKEAWSPYQKYLTKRKTHGLYFSPSQTAHAAAPLSHGVQTECRSQLSSLHSAGALSTLLAPDMCLLFLWLFVLT